MPTPSAPVERWSPGVSALVLASLGVAVYARSVGTPFVFDDDLAVVRNPAIRSLGSAFALIPGTILAVRPVVQLSLAANYWAGGLAPAGYHAVNVALHVIAGLLLFGVVRRTLASPALAARYAAVATPLGFAVAALWIVHPLQVEAVAYVTQRTELLMGCFYLLALYAAARAWESRPTVWYAVAIGACALGMLSKEVMVSAPVLLVLSDRLFWCGSFEEALRRRWPLYTGLAATWVLLAAVLLTTPQNPTLGFGHGMTPWEYLRTQAGVILRYLGLVVWPARLSIDHGTWIASNAASLLPGVVVVSLVVLTGWALARGEPAGFLGAWFFLILAPTSSVVPILTETMAERRMYLPLAAVLTLVVLGAHALVARTSRRTSAAAALLVAALVVLSAQSVRRLGDFRSGVAIWSDAVAKRPDNPRAHYNLGQELEDTGESRAALEQYLATIRFQPEHVDARNNLARLVYQKGKVGTAEKILTEVARRRPTNVQARTNLCLILYDQGDADAAYPHCTAAVALDAESAAAHLNLANVLTARGAVDDAITHYETSLRLQPDSPNAHNNLAGALLASGRFDAAIAHYREALRLLPDSTDIAANLRAAEERARSGPRRDSAS